MNHRSHAPIQHVSHTFVSYEVLRSFDSMSVTYVHRYIYISIPSSLSHVQLQTPLTAEQLLMCVNALLQSPVMCDCIPIVDAIHSKHRKIAALFVWHISYQVWVHHSRTITQLTKRMHGGTWYIQYLYVRYSCTTWHNCHSNLATVPTHI